MNHSNLRRAYLFSREDTLALMEAHRNCFRALGGTPQVMAYDNCAVAVKKFLGERSANIPMPCAAWNSTIVSPLIYCNPRSGWEKGKVERSVEHIRQRAFAYDVRFGSLEQAQCHLDKVCEKAERGGFQHVCAREEGARTGRYCGFAAA